MHKSQEIKAESDCCCDTLAPSERNYPLCPAVIAELLLAFSMLLSNVFSHWQNH